MLLNDSTCTGLFLKYFYDNAMLQFVDAQPTRLGILLDIVLCNDTTFCQLKLYLLFTIFMLF
jgi:hypothetical protein